MSLSKAYYEYSIKDVKISYDHEWTSKHLNMIKQYYKGAYFFEEVYPLVERHILKKYNFIADLDINIIFEICKYLGIPVDKFKLSSEINIGKDIRKGKRLLSILLNLGQKVSFYLSGDSAKNYLDENMFKKEGIKVLWHEYKHPYYTQNLWGSDIFITHLSAIDVLFDHGKKSLDIMTGKIVIPATEGIRIINAESWKGVGPK